MRFKFYLRSQDEIDKTLYKYGLDSFHQRILKKIFIFSYKILNNKSSPIQLQKWLNIKTLNNNYYNLRSNNTNVFSCDKSNTKYGDKTFKNIFSKILNFFDIKFLFLNYREFVNKFFLDKQILLDKLLKSNSNLKIDIDFYFYNN